MAAFDPAALDALPDRRPLGLAEAVFRPMIETGNVAVHVHGGYALDVGTIERYLQANDDVLNGRVGTIVSPGEVLPLATGGRAYLGPDAHASPATLGSGAVVLRGASVPAGAMVRAAVVWPNERRSSGCSCRARGVGRGSSRDYRRERSARSVITFG